MTIYKRLYFPTRFVFMHYLPQGSLESKSIKILGRTHNTDIVEGDRNCCFSCGDLWRFSVCAIYTWATLTDVPFPILSSLQRSCWHYKHTPFRKNTMHSHGPAFMFGHLSLIILHLWPKICILPCTPTKYSKLMGGLEMRAGAELRDYRWEVRRGCFIYLTSWKGRPGTGQPVAQRRMKDKIKAILDNPSHPVWAVADG